MTVEFIDYYDQLEVLRNKAAHSDAECPEEEFDRLLCEVITQGLKSVVGELK